MDKASWRAEMLRRRGSLPPARRRLAARRITQNVLSLAELQGASFVGLYADFRGEVPTARLALLLCSAGKELALPAADPKSKTLTFHRVAHWHQLHVGFYGIREPNHGCPAVSPRDLDLLIVPGLGFDRRGYRLGYGAGYYDRFLPGLAPGCRAVGLAFACQVAPLLPHEPMDRPVDLIVTEDEIIRPLKMGCQ